MSDQELQTLVSECTSYSEVLRRQGKAITGNSQRLLKKKLSELGIDTSHFTTRGIQRPRAKSPTSRDDLERQLSDGTLTNVYTIKVLLLRLQAKPHQCEECKNTEWNGHPIPLQLHHIDGNHFNNRMENLSLLCPNCHAQTETWGARRLKKPVKHCCDCGAELSARRSTRCNRCASLKRAPRIEWPSIESLKESLKTQSMESLGKQLGVSGVAVKKHLRKAEK